MVLGELSTGAWLPGFTLVGLLRFRLLVLSRDA
jgi:hypothetical protein